MCGRDGWGELKRDWRRRICLLYLGASFGTAIPAPLFFPPPGEFKFEVNRNLFFFFSWEVFFSV